MSAAPRRSPSTCFSVGAGRPTASGVTMAPGQMQFTRMPYSPSSRATDLVRWITPALATLYRCGPTPASIPATLAVLRMLPERCRFMTGAACLMPRKTPLSSTSNVMSYSSTLVLSIGPSAPPKPALLKRQSSRPQRATAVSTAASTSVSSVTLTCANAPSAPSSRASSCPLSSCMSAITTRAPSTANRRTVAAPIPLAPPVTSATLPSSFPITSLRFLVVVSASRQRLDYVYHWAGRSFVYAGGGQSVRVGGGEDLEPVERS